MAKDSKTTQDFEFWNKRVPPKDFNKLLTTIQREADKQIGQFIRGNKLDLSNNYMVNKYMKDILPNLWNDPELNYYKRIHLDRITGYISCFVFGFVFKNSTNIGKAEKQAELASNSFIKGVE